MFLESITWPEGFDPEAAGVIFEDALFQVFNGLLGEQVAVA